MVGWNSGCPAFSTVAVVPLYYIVLPPEPIPGMGDTSCTLYVYTVCLFLLQLADVHLKESCDDGPQVFVLSIHGENKMMYRLQVSATKYL